PSSPASPVWRPRSPPPSDGAGPSPPTTARSGSSPAPPPAAGRMRTWTSSSRSPARHSRSCRAPRRFIAVERGSAAGGRARGPTLDVSGLAAARGGDQLWRRHDRGGEREVLIRALHADGRGARVAARGDREAAGDPVRDLGVEELGDGARSGVPSPESIEQHLG